MRKQKIIVRKILEATCEVFTNPYDCASCGARVTPREKQYIGEGQKWCQRCALGVKRGQWPMSPGSGPRTPFEEVVEVEAGAGGPIVPPGTEWRSFGDSGSQQESI